MTENIKDFTEINGISQSFTTLHVGMTKCAIFIIN